MRRREFIVRLGAAVSLWPVTALAQQGHKLPVVGLVSIGASVADPANFRPFLEQMRELSYEDGQNIIFDRRFAGGDDSLISGFVADLVRRPVDVIVATGAREALAAKSATATIPIVTFVSADPIGMGLAQSLAHPGGNVTGLSTMDLDVYGKRVELLSQTVPNLKRVAVLVSGRQPFMATIRRGRTTLRCQQNHWVSHSSFFKPTNTLWKPRSQRWPRTVCKAWSSLLTASTFHLAKSLRKVRSSIGYRQYFLFESTFERVDF